MATSRGQYQSTGPKRIAPGRSAQPAATTASAAKPPQRIRNPSRQPKASDIPVASPSAHMAKRGLFTSRRTIFQSGKNSSSQNASEARNAEVPHSNQPVRACREDSGETLPNPSAAAHTAAVRTMRIGIIAAELTHSPAPQKIPAATNGQRSQRVPLVSVPGNADAGLPKPNPARSSKASMRIEKAA
jgi:hypothetical protein